MSPKPHGFASRIFRSCGRLCLLACAAAAGTALSVSALAQQALVDTEPNDTPQTATRFSAPMTLMGTMPGGDQDGWMWVVSDEDAGRRWRLELIGIPGRLTLVQVARPQFNEAGDVKEANRIFKFGSRDGQRPGVTDGVFFEPGEYLLGIARSGGDAPYRPLTDNLSFGDAGATSDSAGADAGGSNAYRLFITEEEKLPASDGSAPWSRDEAVDILPDRERAVLFEDENPAWYRIRFSDEQASSHWDINVQVPAGGLVEARLQNSADETLATTRNNAEGKAKLTNISLPAGDYYVEVSPIIPAGEPAGFVQTLLLTEAGQRVAGSEAEPNNSWALANHSDDSACCTGRLGEKGDEDFFRYVFEAAQLDTLKSLTLESESDDTLQVCLLNDRGRTIQCRSGKSAVSMNDLLLMPGTYGVKVSGRNAGTGYRLAFGDAGPIDPAQETEPNDKRAYAVGTPENNRIRGSFDGRDDVDFYRFVIEDEPQIWRVMTVGQNIEKIEYHDSVGGLNQRIEAGRNQRRVSLENLFLLPGTHYVSVTGRAAGDYTLLARALGPPDPNGELEPNDDESRMQTLRIGQERTGLLNNADDVDLYKFHLAGWDHIRLKVSPPVDGKLAAALNHDGMQVGEAQRTDGEIVMEGIFPPGDYRLSLEPRETSDAEYRVSLQRGDRFSCADDCEPNNNPVFASPFPRGRVLSGQSGNWGDRDFYVLPPAPEAREVTFVTEITNDLRIYDASLNQLEFEYDREANVYRGSLPAGERHFMRIGKGNVPDDYSVTMLIGDETEPPPAPTALPAEIDLGLDATSVTAYERFGQRVTGELTIRNTGTSPLPLALDVALSDARWFAKPASDAVTVAPGAAESVALDITAPPDVWADKPVRISVRATGNDGGMVTQFADLNVSREGLPTNPVHAWNIPAELRGGLNLARSALGATGTAEPMPKNHSEKTLAELFDGRAAIGYGPEFRGNRDAPQQVTVKLAGNQPVPVAGFALNPLYREFKHRTPRDVAFQLSENGASFDTVLEGQLTTIGTDQYFVLEEPVLATHARLLPTTNWAGKFDDNLTLGEWKVIARDGFDPAKGEGRNIGSPELGGHVVWSKPPMRGRESNLLSAEDEKLRVKLPDDMPLEWVIGFHHGRVAKIERIDWIDRVVSGKNIDELTVSRSLESPVGPWEPVATWSRSESPNELTLDAPVWARYLRFSVAADAERPNLNLPETIAVREVATGDDYRSILSEWGVNSRSAWYESQQPVPVREGLARRGNESRSAADQLQPGQPESGYVKLLEQSHWYRPQLPAGHNTLVLTIEGDPTVRTELELTSGSGDTIALNKVYKDSRPDQHVYETYIESPAAGILLEVREPPRSVMFMWDTSPSIGRYRPMIYKSLLAYAEDLVPEVDTANLLPFGAGSPLLDDWYGEPYLMQLILNDHARKEGSSAAEHANAMATRALAPRPGTKAMVTITDAETPAYPKMWDGMKEVQPRVFSMHVGPGAASQDLMQSWSSVNGGYYSHVIHENEMDIAFERAATMLRRPAKYTLSLETETRDAPGPGFLRVVSSGDGGPARGAVELILDASGSMLQRMEGRRRIEIAKEVLTTAIQEQIPAGTPTALRVFGHRTPNACEADLEMPLAPLDAEAAVSKIAGIQAKNLARTPIADSLAAVKQDLKGANGTALIVLVTDGEETCDGNPAAVIEKLRESGMEVSLNIVGFAIDDQELADEFAAWAEAGGGSYFAANDTETLATSVADALATSFRVFNANDEEVAVGRVDADPIQLEQGSYRVVLETVPRTILTASITQGKTTELSARNSQ